LSEDDKAIAVSSLAVIMRSNTKLSDLANDARFALARPGYDILSGTGG
jgi:hypothetical protein